ncbi:molybdate ABC transporter permease subunit [Ornithinibacillus contaminans]|uniref:molybdate ABC transporter permease subunit n=1 Tax=Ornithinibacillus contaminans TaxID=694055 RepID=UPI00064DFFD6|nr:molybdate ABC transporter permease subunit [Ornithinibacillus contaminans]
MEFSWLPVKLSIYVSVVATVITFFIGVFISYWMVRKKVKGKALIETILFLPLVLPPSVIGFILIIVFGSNSVIGQAIQMVTGESIIFTVTAAVIAAIVVALPLMYQSIKTGFQSVDSNIIGAAKVDGAGDMRVLWRIIIPVSSKAIIAGVILSFTRAFGEFGATLMFAGNIPGQTQTIPTAIYLSIESGQTQIAWYYVLISIAFSFMLLFSINRK